MSLFIEPFPLGPIGNISYLVADSLTHSAVIIDPSFGSQIMLKRARQLGLQLEAVWLTHAHFDHIAGVEQIAEAFQPPLPIGLHPDDIPLWRTSGGAASFGMPFEVHMTPTLLFTHKQLLPLGSETIEVRHTPGHTPGHVVFYYEPDQVVFCGDLIFPGSVGRTDLPGGSHSILMVSIHQQILSLPPETRLLSGHDDETTVGREMRENPFLN